MDLKLLRLSMMMLLLQILQVSSFNHGCQQTFCSYNYSPVCAYNQRQNRTFINRCKLNNYNKCNKEEYIYAYDGECKEVIIPNQDCPIYLCSENKPVCAFNGKDYQTFTNICEISYYNCRYKDVYEKKYDGDCKEANNCPNSCPYDFKFVCGSNGTHFTTFVNECDLMAYNCNNRNNVFKFKSSGKCSNSCNIRCPSASEPICAGNGKDKLEFENSCYIEIYNCENNENFKILNSGPCQKEPTCPEFCNLVYQPICAFNGRKNMTFGNDCGLESYNCLNPHDVYQFISNGECIKSPKDGCYIGCEFIYEPLCAFNGKIRKDFNSLCELEEFNCEKNETFKYSHFGKCQPEPCPEFCDHEPESPVCAFDGMNNRTFANECFLAQHNCLNPNDEFKYSHDGECQEIRCGKPCPRNISPVCGYNKKNYRTFPNECVMEYFNLCNPKEIYEVKYQGECSTGECKTDCHNIFNPLCAYNGKKFKEFNSSCDLDMFNCNIKDKFQYSHNGKCQPKPCPEFCEYAPESPVCAFNGKFNKTFANKCFLARHNCLNPNDVFNEKSKGKCPSIETCRSVCEFTYYPICAYDGVLHHTFFNMCALDSYNCDRKTYRAKKVFDGECGEIFQGKKCIDNKCAAPWKTVCASRIVDREKLMKEFPDVCFLRKYNCENDYEYRNFTYGSCNYTTGPTYLPPV